MRLPTCACRPTVPTWPSPPYFTERGYAVKPDGEATCAGRRLTAGGQASCCRLMRLAAHAVRPVATSCWWWPTCASMASCTAWSTGAAKRLLPSAWAAVTTRMALQLSLRFGAAQMSNVAAEPLLVYRVPGGTMPA